MEDIIAQRPMFSPGGQAPAGGGGIEGLSNQMKMDAKFGLMNANSPEEAINAMRGDNLPLEARYQELAMMVGPDDAQATPPAVLTLVQPALIMGSAGGGIEGLMPAAADMPPAAGGIGQLMMDGAPPQQFASGGRGAMHKEVPLR